MDHTKTPAPVIRYVTLRLPVKGDSDLDSGDLAALLHLVVRLLDSYSGVLTERERQVLDAIYTKPF